MVPIFQVRLSSVFVKSELQDLFGSLFCDFGPAFTAINVDGEEPHTGVHYRAPQHLHTGVSFSQNFTADGRVVLSKGKGHIERNSWRLLNQLSLKVTQERQLVDGAIIRFDNDEILHKASRDIPDSVIPKCLCCEVNKTCKFIRVRRRVQFNTWIGYKEVKTIIDGVAAMATPRRVSIRMMLLDLPILKENKTNKKILLCSQCR